MFLTGKEEQQPYFGLLKEVKRSFNKIRKINNCLSIVVDPILFLPYEINKKLYFSNIFLKYFPN